MFRVYVDPYRQSQEMALTSMAIENHREIKVDFSQAASVKGTTVSSVAWSSEGSREITISNTSLSSGVATGSVYSDHGGHGLLKVQATYADGRKETQFIRIRIDDPEYQIPQTA